MHIIILQATFPMFVKKSYLRILPSLLLNKQDFSITFHDTAYIYTFGVTTIMILCMILFLFWRKAKVVWKQIIQSMIIGNVVDHWPDISENVFSNCLVTLTNDMTIGEIAHTGLLKLSQIHDMIYVLWKWFCQMWV